MKTPNAMLSILTCLMACVVPGRAFAQPEASEAGASETQELTDEDYSAAEEIGRAANAAHARGEYVEAVDLYISAYKRVPGAVFLSSAARSASDGGTLAQARRLAVRALENTEFPLDDEARKGVEKLIVELDARVAAELAKTGEWSWVGYTGAGLATLGVASVVGTLVVAAGVDARREELGASTRRSEYDALYDELSGQQQFGQALLYSGAALLAVGGGLIVWDLATPGGVPYEQPTLSLELSPARAHVQVGWRF